MAASADVCCAGLALCAGEAELSFEEPAAVAAVLPALLVPLAEATVALSAPSSAASFAFCATS